jgi:hypothetical protein
MILINVVMLLIRALSHLRIAPFICKAIATFCIALIVVWQIVRNIGVGQKMNVTMPKLKRESGSPSLSFITQ